MKQTTTSLALVLMVLLSIVASATPVRAQEDVKFRGEAVRVVWSTDGNYWFWTVRITEILSEFEPGHIAVGETRQAWWTSDCQASVDKSVRDGDQVEVYGEYVYEDGTIRVCDQYHYVRLSGPPPPPPPVCSEGAVQPPEMCPDGKTWTHRRVCRNNAWVDEYQQCPVPPKQAPTAYIDSISPNPAEQGQTVSFSGHGSDPDGYIVEYNWRSSIDGQLSSSQSFSTSSLSVGTHTIYFKVKDNDGAWSGEATTTLLITSPQPTTGNLRVKVLDSQTQQALDHASVYVDESYRGDTDSSGILLLSGLSAGGHAVECRKSGYKSTTGSAYVETGSTQQIEIHMEREVIPSTEECIVIIKHEGASTIVRICAKRVQEIKTARPEVICGSVLGSCGHPVYEASWRTVSGIWAMVTLSELVEASRDLKGWAINEIKGDPATWLDRASLVQSVLNEIQHNPALLSKLKTAVGVVSEAAIEGAIATGLGIIVDISYASLDLYLVVNGWAEPEKRYPDGSIEVRLDWLEEKTMEVLYAIGACYYLLLKEGLLQLLSEEIPTPNTVALKEPLHKLYLHVFDSAGRHVGLDRPSGRVVNEIPGASYFDLGNIMVIVLSKQMAEYRYTVDALDAQAPQESYDVILSSFGRGEGVQLIHSSISKGTQEEHSVVISPVDNAMSVDPSYVERLWSTGKEWITLGAILVTVLAVSSGVWVAYSRTERKRQRRLPRQAGPIVKEIRSTTGKPRVKSIQEDQAKPKVLRIDDD